MRRGEIRLVDLDPAVGPDANKRRPAVVVSNDGANTAAVRLGLPRDSKAQAEQVRSVAVQRVGAVVGQLPPGVMADLEGALGLHLAL